LDSSLLFFLPSKVTFSFAEEAIEKQLVFSKKLKVKDKKLENKRAYK